jgi:NAD dependent epimerase/dehydratase family enzyme|tara:strand:- start:695 stop:1117 length:423 start_codon:yes stop_codon:yes gene_type:complete
MRNPPQTFLSASAIGFYGNNKQVELYEDLRPGKGFLVDVCKDWEHEALLAQDYTVRIIILRIGIVPGRDGGALKKILTPFCVGLGGKLEDGNQWMSWIHIKDLVNMIIHSVEKKILKEFIMPLVLDQSQMKCLQKPWPKS